MPLMDLSYTPITYRHLLEDWDYELQRLRNGEGKSTVTVSLVKDKPLPVLTARWLAAMWLRWERENPFHGATRFLRFLTTVASETRNVVLCDHCLAPRMMEDAVQVESATVWACLPCVRLHYAECSNCNVNTAYRTTDLSGASICNVCRDNDWAHCAHCRGYYPQGEADAHYHDTTCQCAPPSLEFHVHNDGDEPLANDTRVTITLPAGAIDDEGIRRIKELLGYGRGEFTGLRMNDINTVVDALDRTWQIRSGNYTRRLSSGFYRLNKTKIPSEILSQVGVIAREHTADTSAVHVEVTRNLNQHPKLFGHAESCWWNSYANSRCTLKNNGGFGLRSFSAPEDGKVTGRAWVLPLKQESGALHPTFDTENAVAYVVFNGYGDLQGYVPTRILSHMYGMTYRKIAFVANPMYVNGDGTSNGSSGYLVSTQEICDNTSELRLSLDMHSRLAQEESVA